MFFQMWLFKFMFAGEQNHSFTFLIDSVLTASPTSFNSNNLYMAFLGWWTETTVSPPNDPRFQCSSFVLCGAPVPRRTSCALWDSQGQWARRELWGPNQHLVSFIRKMLLRFPVPCSAGRGCRLYGARAQPARGRSLLLPDCTEVSFAPLFSLLLLLCFVFWFSQREWILNSVCFPLRPRWWCGFVFSSAKGNVVLISRKPAWGHQD